MEAELLRDMVTDRDRRIEKIQHKTEDLRLRAIVISSHLERVGKENKEQSTAFTSEKSELVRRKDSVVERLEQSQKDFKQQGVSLQTYSRDTVQGGNDSSYVMRMQAQLCKAMHSLGITDHQMELVVKHSEADAKFHKEILATCTEERTATELELMNQLILKDNERRDFESVFTTQLDKIAKEREAIERQIEENSGDEDEDEKNDEEQEEEDPEEKEAKEELMKLLTERRVEIERLEQLQEEQDDLIAELEDQVSYDDDGRAAVRASTATSKSNLGDNDSAEGNDDQDDDQDNDDNDDQDNDDDENDEGKDNTVVEGNEADVDQHDKEATEDSMRRTDTES